MIKRERIGIGALWLLLLFATLLVPRDLLHQCTDEHDAKLGHSSETASVHGSCAICQVIAPVFEAYVDAVSNGPLLITPLEPSIVAHNRPYADMEALSGRGPPRMA